MKNRFSFQISELLLSNLHAHPTHFSSSQAEKLTELSASPDPSTFKILANFLKSSRYSSPATCQYLFASFLRLLSPSNESFSSKTRMKEFENIAKILLGVVVDIELSSSLPQSVASIALPVKKRLDQIMQKVMGSIEEQDLTVLEKTLLKVLLSLKDQEFFLFVQPDLLRERLPSKTAQILSVFKEMKVLEKRKEVKLVFSLILLGKLIRVSEESFETLSEISKTSLRFFKKLLKSAKFGFKTIGLLNLILSITANFKPSDPKNFETIDIPSLIRLVLDSVLESLEKQQSQSPPNRYMRLFEFLEDWIPRLKQDKLKIELIETLTSFYFRFRALSRKALTNPKEGHPSEKRDSYSKNASLSLIQGGESFKGIFPEDAKKTYLKMFRGMKDMILGLMIRGFELGAAGLREPREEESGRKDSAGPEVSFMMVFSKNYMGKMLAGEGTVATEGKEDTLQVYTPSLKSPENIEEMNIFACLKGLLKRNESQGFRCFLFETVNSKLKVKTQGNSRNQNLLFRLLFKFNVQAAMLIKDMDVAKKVIFDMFSRFEEAEDEELKSYILNLARNAILKTNDRAKVAYLISQQIIRFSKLIFELDFLNEKSSSSKSLSSTFPIFELLSISTEKFAAIKGNYASDPSLFKQFFNVWFFLMLFEKEFEAQVKHHLKTFAFYSPNLVEISNKLFSNQIIANELASNPKLIEKFHRPFKHKLRDQYLEQRPKIKALSLGEMVYCQTVIAITTYKIQVFLEDTQKFHSTFPETCFIDWILCYIRDNNLNQTQNLKFVLEAIIIDKSKKYLEILKSSLRSTESIQQISRDFRYLVQGSCSINRLLLRRCESLLREYIVNFPELVFQQENLIAIAETLNILYRKVKSEFESISSVLKAEFLTEKIVLPNNHKDLGNTLLFLMGALVQLVLRGHFIAHKHLVRSVMFIINHKNKGSNSLEFGYKFLRFLTINFKFHNVDCYDSASNLLYSFSWLVDRQGFNKRMETIELKDYLDESIKVLMTLPPSSLEIALDFRAVLSSIDNLTTNELEGLYEDKPSKYKQLKTYEISTELYEEISMIQFNLFLLHLAASSRSILPDLLSNKALLSYISPKLVSLKSALSKNPRLLYRKLDDSKDSLSSDLFDHLLHLKSIIKKNPSESLLIFQNLLEISKVFCLPKVFKFILQHILPSCYLTKSSNFDDRFFFTLFELTSYIIVQINRLTNSKPEDKTTSSDIFSIHSESFKSVNRAEFLDFANSHSRASPPAGKPSVYNPFKPGLFTFSLLNYRVSRSLKLAFCDKVFKILSKSLSEHMNVLLAKKSELRRLFAVLSLPFGFDKRGLEQLALTSVCYAVINNLEFYQVMKFYNERFQTFTKEELRLFLVKTLNLGLMYFAKSGLPFQEDIYDKKSNLKQCGQKLNLFLKTCKYLQKEQLTNESVEVFTSYQTKKLIMSNKKQEYYYLKQTRKTVHKNLAPVISYPQAYRYGVSFLKTNISKARKLNLDLLRKMLVLLISNDIDRLKGFNCIHLQNFKNEFSLEDRVFSDSEALTYISSLAGINLNLAVSFFFRFRFAVGNETRVLEILSEKVAENPAYYQQFNHLLDFYIMKQIGSSPNTNFELVEIFYWKIPHIQLLLKYIRSDYEKFPLLQIFFTKTLKRLNGEQLLYYLPQIFQAMETNSGLLVQKFLIDFSRTSQLFSHQLIWKSKVEMRIEDKKPGLPMNMLRVQESALRLPRKVYRNMSPEEKGFFIRVNAFFEQVTAISGVLTPSMDKKKKKEIIKEKLLLIKIPNEIYLTSNPKYKVVGINFDSGTPMQSHARVPIRVSFYCKKFEGPDQYFERVMKGNAKEDENADEFTNLLLDDSLLEEEIETLHINELHNSINPKLIPKEPGNNAQNEKNAHSTANNNTTNSNLILKSKTSSLVSGENIRQKDYHSKKSEKKPSALKEKDSSYQLTENEENARNRSFPEKMHTKKFTMSVKNDTVGDLLRTQKRSMESSILNNEKSMETVSCIFKVFDDIRQDSLALQIIRLFKEIFKKVGLDLFLFPYRTISNRSGKEGDIGGIIECVPNSISRDEMGKTHKCNLFEFFIGKFGQVDSPEFQIARDNFIKSQAAYSVVSYILQIKDRHNGNILIDESGHLVHIDFGFIFDISPAHNMRFESADFKLTMEMIQIMGGSYQSEEFNYYTDLTVKAFLMIRKYHEHIFNLIRLIFKSGLKCFRPNSLEHLKQRFMLNKNDLAAAKSMKAIIYQSYDKFTTNVYDKIQNWQNNIHY